MAGYGRSDKGEIKSKIEFRLLSEQLSDVRSKVGAISSFQDGTETMQLADTMGQEGVALNFFGCVVRPIAQNE